MTEKQIIFDNFEFPILKGLEYLFDKEKSVTDYLFVKDARSDFSMYFEKDFPTFRLPDGEGESYYTFEIKLPLRKISFFCPQKNKRLNTVVWYFCLEITDEDGARHELAGQITLMLDELQDLIAKGKPKFIEVLENIKVSSSAVSA